MGSSGEMEDGTEAGVMALGGLAVGVIAVLFAVGILFGVFQLMGALKYNVCILTTCLVFQVLNLVFTCFNAWNSAETAGQGVIAVIIQALITVALWIYPLVGLIKEINAGIMTEETYPREAYSCCCEPQV